MKLRLLPIVMLTGFAALSLRIAEHAPIEFSSVHAQDSADSAAGENSDGASSETSGNDTPAEPGKDKPTAPTGTQQKGASEAGGAEQELLQGLSKRRQELEEWENAIKMKENVLNVTEVKINEKMDALKKLEQEVQVLLKQYNEKEELKIRGLVKIYENMKPKDAAKVFEKLEMSVLLLVIDRMKEAKSAPILAAMDPQKARDITTDLMHQRQLAAQNAAAAKAAVQ